MYGIASVRLHYTLGGAVTQISGWSASQPEDVEVNGKPFVRVPFTFDLLEAGAQVYAA